MRDLFLDNFRTLEFKAMFEAFGLIVPDFLRCAASALRKASSKTLATVSGTFEKRPTHSEFTSIFGAVEGRSFRTRGTQQRNQTLPTALGRNRLSDTDGRDDDVSRDVLTYNHCIFTYIKAASYIQLLFSNFLTSKQKGLIRTPRSIFLTLIYNTSIRFHSRNTSVVRSKRRYLAPTRLCWQTFCYGADLPCIKKGFETRQPWKLEQFYSSIDIQRNRYSHFFCSARYLCWLRSSDSGIRISCRWHSAVAREIRCTKMLCLIQRYWQNMLSAVFLLPPLSTLTVSWRYSLQAIRKHAVSVVRS